MRSYQLTDIDSHLRWIDFPGDGPAHVFLHGLGCAGSADFSHIAAHPRFAGRRAIVVDLLGHGYSDRPTDFSYTLHAHARTVADLLDHCDVDGCVLIGHSMGGAIAIVLATLRPELFSRVIVAEPNLHPGAGMFSGPITAYTEQDFVAHGFRTVLKEFEPGYAARVRVTDPAALYRSALGLVRGTEPDTAAQLLALPHPRALLVGAHNRPYEDEEEIRSAGIPVIEVPGAGHDMMHDNPDGFAAALAAAVP
ncbi:alpha/beta fold hydrolase [Streptomyces sp. CA-250714]|uniref:alpha/beta fold hydrolase n=1 Tax=Streptomyces sp. CA-250714 TaxID=3240060 RepID=UPI003D8CEF25